MQGKYWLKMRQAVAGGKDISFVISCLRIVQLCFLSDIESVVTLIRNGN